MNKNKIIADNICLTHCPERWCCTIDKFCPPPLCKNEIRKIKTIGMDDFYQKSGELFTLKTKSNGYCIFFSNKHKKCKIYDIRPFDCRIFPFDFVTFTRERGFWVIWNCSFSSRLTSGDIEKSLAFFENYYAENIFETWNFGNEDYKDKIISGAARDFRILRRLKIHPPSP